MSEEYDDASDSYASENGNVKIADEVVSVIAGIAATEVDGVVGMSGGFAGGLTELLGKKNLTKGVKVHVSEKEVSLDIFILVGYGVRIPDIAQEVQEKVKLSVESMTGLSVTEINVHIQGVSFLDELKENEIASK
jgi:uncharacterized alkaline shock family protein YloU